MESNLNNTLVSFGALSMRSAKVLVLGSMPGVASLQAQQYYAHPRNSFWPIMASIAVWDVLRSCVRPGSLDSSIAAGTRVPNDFSSFFAAHPGIGLVCFNGSEAQQSYNRLVLPGLGERDMRYTRLPSTSPAHSVAFERKLAAWRAALAE